jgi:hypothetical protein
MKRILVALLCLSVTAVSAEAAGRWCGKYARTSLVSQDPGTKYNLACNWKEWGHATTPHEGAMVVWCSGGHHHVGKITGPCNGSNCMVTSGNDGGRVRSRVRSIADAAAFRE